MAWVQDLPRSALIDGLYSLSFPQFESILVLYLLLSFDELGATVDDVTINHTLAQFGISIDAPVRRCCPSGNGLQTG